MKIKTLDLNLVDGTATAEVYVYEKTDKQELKKFYKAWIEMSNLSKKLGGRLINLPEVLSESAFCMAMGDNFVRLKSCSGGVNKSFDCVKLTSRANQDIRIQVKGTSVTSNLTNFGSNSQWDEIYFCDFSRRDGTFDIYHIPSHLIYNHPVNKIEKMKDMQKSGKHSRMRLSEIIGTNNLIPCKKFKL